MDVRVEPSVLWREGMFLCPQHLQAFSREIQSRIRQAESLGTPGSFGVLRLRVDDESLARDKFMIEEATLLLRDGTLCDFQKTAVVEPREFAEHFVAPELDVWLGVPAAIPNVPQVDYGGEGSEQRHARFLVHSAPTFDENMRDAVKDLEFRQQHGRLFFGEEDRTGFECVPIARLVRRGKPVARSVPSPTYVPPSLRCGASNVLMLALREMAALVRGQARDLAERVPATAGLSSVQKGADIAGFVKLQAVNQCVATLDQIAGLPDVHPYHAYIQLVQAVGNLSIFGPERTVPELPVYDHEDLDTCFQTVFRVLRDLAGANVAVPYETEAFKKDPVREGFYEVEIPREWISRSPLFYLAVEVKRSAEGIADQVRSGVKLISPDDVNNVLMGVIPGIEITHERMPPLSFPKRGNLHFFRILTEGESRDPWLRVLQSRSAVLLSTLGSLGDVGFHLYVELRSG